MRGFPLVVSAEVLELRRVSDTPPLPPLSLLAAPLAPLATDGYLALVNFVSRRLLLTPRRLRTSKKKKKELDAKTEPTLAAGSTA